MQNYSSFLCILTVISGTRVFGKLSKNSGMWRPQNLAKKRFFYWQLGTESVLQIFGNIYWRKGDKLWAVSLIFWFTCSHATSDIARPTLALFSVWIPPWTWWRYVLPVYKHRDTIKHLKLTLRVIVQMKTTRRQSTAQKPGERLSHVIGRKTLLSILFHVHVWFS